MDKNKELVSISCRGNRGLVDPRTIRRRASRVLEAAGHPFAKLSLLLCDDEFIKHLNCEFRQKDTPTDVLSFSMVEGEIKSLDSELLGDVVVSVETALRQAEEAGRTTTDEVTSLIIHGILHLLGYDHENQKDERKMFKEAFRIEEIVLGSKN